MTLTRWQRPAGFGLAPWQLRYALHNDLSQLLASIGSAFGSRGETGFSGGRFPAIDVHEDKTTVTVKAELPGLKKEDINISLHDGVLTLSGERKGQTDQETNGVSRHERWFGRFERQITLPSKVDPKSIPATYADGILSVTLNKAEEAKPKQIKIEFN